MLNKCFFSVFVIILSVNPLFADEKQSVNGENTSAVHHYVMKDEKNDEKSSSAKTRLYNFKQNKIVFIDDISALTKEQGSEYIPLFYPGADALYEGFIKNGDSVVAAISKTTVKVKEEIDKKIIKDKKQH